MGVTAPALFWENLYKSSRLSKGFSIQHWHVMPPRERKPVEKFNFKELGGRNPTPPPAGPPKKPKFHLELKNPDGTSVSFLTTGFMPILAPPQPNSPDLAVAAPTTVVAPEYWGNDENTVFVETLTDASRTSLRWEHEQLENTVMFSATGQGVRTIFHNGE